MEQAVAPLLGSERFPKIAYSYLMRPILVLQTLAAMAALIPVSIAEAQDSSTVQAQAPLLQSLQSAATRWTAFDSLSCREEPHPAACFCGRHRRLRIRVLPDVHRDR